MPTTLANGAVVLTLPEDMLWPNEFSWSGVQQRARYSVMGALIVEAQAKAAGRPLTLQSGDDYAWMPRSTLETLLTWSRIPGQQFTLSYRGTNYAVVFDHERGAIDADPIIDYADPVATDDYAVTLRFLQV